MFTVYVLYSVKHDKIYIGYTSDLDARLISHNSLATKGHSIKFRPCELLVSEEHPTKTEALKREKQLKSGAGRRWIWEKVKEKYGD